MLSCYDYAKQMVEPKWEERLANHSLGGLAYILYESHKLDKLPTSVFFNKKKKATTLLFDDEVFVVKCDTKDTYNKRIGFLEAYFQAQSGMSKTQANKYLRELVE